MRILVTGCAGFVGPHLVRELRGAGHQVFGTALEQVGNPLLEGGCSVAADLAEPGAARGVLEWSHPDAVINLAGQSHVPSAWTDPAGTYRANVQAVIELLKAATAVVPRCRCVLISSAEVYGVVSPHYLPLRESSPIQPVNPYASSKAAAEEVARILCSQSTLSLVISRSFTHTGPGQTTAFVCPAFAQQVARIKAGAEDVVRHGDLTPRRDFLDVRDIVAAYRLMAETPELSGEYNLCSGRSIAMSEILETLFDLAGMHPRTEVDPARLRKADIPDIRGDSSRLKAATNWSPRFTMRQTLADILAEYSN